MEEDMIALRAIFLATGGSSKTLEQRLLKVMRTESKREEALNTKRVCFLRPPEFVSSLEGTKPFTYAHGRYDDFYCYQDSGLFGPGYYLSDLGRALGERLRLDATMPDNLKEVPPPGEKFQGILTKGKRALVDDEVHLKLNETPVSSASLPIASATTATVSSSSSSSSLLSSSASISSSGSSITAGIDTNVDCCDEATNAPTERALTPSLPSMRYFSLVREMTHASSDENKQVSNDVEEDVTLGHQHIRYLETRYGILAADVVIISFEVDNEENEAPRSCRTVISEVPDDIVFSNGPSKEKRNVGAPQKVEDDHLRHLPLVSMWKCVEGWLEDSLLGSFDPCADRKTKHLIGASLESNDATSNINVRKQQQMMRADVANWYGISVRDNRVFGIDLPQNNLTGSIANCELNGSEEDIDFPQTIKKPLTFLVHLNLESNSIYGKIPQWIRVLQSLEIINLSHNSFRGNLFYDASEAENHNDKQQLDIYGTFHTESIFDVLSSLRVVLLSHNKLTGPLPSFRCCARLEKVDMGHNDFSGAFPVGSFAKHPSLLHLDISSNLGITSPRKCEATEYKIIDTKQNNEDKFAVDMLIFLFRHLRFYDISGTSIGQLSSEYDEKKAEVDQDDDDEDEDEDEMGSRASNNSVSSSSPACSPTRQPSMSNWLRKGLERDRMTASRAEADRLERKERQRLRKKERALQLEKERNAGIEHTAEQLEELEFDAFLEDHQEDLDAQSIYFDDSFSNTEKKENVDDEATRVMRLAAKKRKEKEERKMKRDLRKKAKKDAEKDAENEALASVDGTEVSNDDQKAKAMELYNSRKAKQEAKAKSVAGLVATAAEKIRRRNDRKNRGIGANAENKSGEDEDEDEWDRRWKSPSASQRPATVALHLAFHYTSLQELSELSWADPMHENNKFVYENPLLPTMEAFIRRQRIAKVLAAGTAAMYAREERARQRRWTNNSPDEKQNNKARWSLTGSLPKGLISILPNMKSLNLSGNEITGPLAPALETLPDRTAVHLPSVNHSMPATLSAIPEKAANETTAIELTMGKKYRVKEELSSSLFGVDYVGLTRNVMMGRNASSVLNKQQEQQPPLRMTEMPSPSSCLDRILDIKLSKNSMSGNLPEALGELRSIRSLDLSNNNFTGPILGDNDTLCGIAQTIEVLELSKNALTGEVACVLEKIIPTFHRLRVIGWGKNRLRGSFEDFFGNDEDEDLILFQPSSHKSGKKDSVTNSLMVRKQAKLDARRRLLTTRRKWLVERDKKDMAGGIVSLNLAGNRGIYGCLPSVFLVLGAQKRITLSFDGCGDDRNEGDDLYGCDDCENPWFGDPDGYSPTYSRRVKRQRAKRSKLQAAATAAAGALREVEVKGGVSRASEALLREEAFEAAAALDAAWGGKRRRDIDDLRGGLYLSMGSLQALSRHQILPGVKIQKQMAMMTVLDLSFCSLLRFPCAAVKKCLPSLKELRMNSNLLKGNLATFLKALSGVKAPAKNGVGSDDVEEDTDDLCAIEPLDEVQQLQLYVLDLSSNDFSGDLARQPLLILNRLKAVLATENSKEHHLRSQNGGSLYLRGNQLLKGSILYDDAAAAAAAAKKDLRVAADSAAYKCAAAVSAAASAAARVKAEEAAKHERKFERRRQSIAATRRSSVRSNASRSSSSTKNKMTVEGGERMVSETSNESTMLSTSSEDMATDGIAASSPQEELEYFFRTALCECDVGVDPKTFPRISEVARRAMVNSCASDDAPLSPTIQRRITYNGSSPSTEERNVVSPINRRPTSLISPLSSPEGNTTPTSARSLLESSPSSSSTSSSSSTKRKSMLKSAISASEVAAAEAESAKSAAESAATAVVTEEDVFHKREGAAVASAVGKVKPHDLCFYVVSAEMMLSLSRLPCHEDLLAYIRTLPHHGASRNGREIPPPLDWGSQSGALSSLETLSMGMMRAFLGPASAAEVRRYSTELGTPKAATIAKGCDSSASLLGDERFVDESKEKKLSVNQTIAASLLPLKQLRARELWLQQPHFTCLNQDRLLQGHDDVSTPRDIDSAGNEHGADKANGTFGAFIPALPHQVAFVQHKWESTNIFSADQNADVPKSSSVACDDSLECALSSGSSSEDEAEAAEKQKRRQKAARLERRKKEHHPDSIDNGKLKHIQSLIRHQHSTAPTPDDQVRWVIIDFLSFPQRRRPTLQRAVLRGLPFALRWCGNVWKVSRNKEELIAIGGAQGVLHAKLKHTFGRKGRVSGGDDIFPSARSAWIRLEDSILLQCAHEEEEEEDKDSNIALQRRIVSVWSGGGTSRGERDRIAAVMWGGKPLRVMRDGIPGRVSEAHDSSEEENGHGDSRSSGENSCDINLTSGRGVENRRKAAAALLSPEGGVLDGQVGDGRDWPTIQRLNSAFEKLHNAQKDSESS